MRDLRDRKALLCDESQFVLFPAQMTDQQRNPDDQSCGPQDDSQRHQTQILPADEERTDGREETLNMPTANPKHLSYLWCVLEPCKG